MSWRHKITLSLLFVLVLFITAEIAVRGFWRIKYSIPFQEPGLIIYSYYPELRSVDQLKPSQSDDYYDILLLGGSVLDPSWGTVYYELHEQMAQAGYHKVRIFNLARPAHTSRDSWLKYALLGEARFELVVFYHGINESRTNNAPPEIFQEDYSHYSWYEFVNDLAHYHKKTSIALPYTLRYISIHLRQIFNKDRYISTDAPRSEWVQYGQNFRSRTSFESNLNAILRLASKRKDKVLLMTFAVHIPADYTDDAFRKKRLDYLLHRFPVKLWGAPENVFGAVMAQNKIVKRIAAQHEDILFVDQANMMKRSSRYFNDASHFTTFGSSKFVEHLLEVLLPSLKGDRLSGKGSK